MESEKKKVAALEVEKSSLREALADVTSKLEEEFRKRKEETEFLTRKLAEKTRAGEVDKQAVIDIHAKMELMKRQNQDLTKELAATKTKLDNQVGTISISMEESNLRSRWIILTIIIYLRLRLYTVFQVLFFQLIAPWGKGLSMFHVTMCWQGERIEQWKSGWLFFY